MSPVRPAAANVSAPSDHRPVRGARSCTLCRQMKARCNASEQAPNPCSRCVHLGKEPCVIVPTFRRVNKRARVAEMENQIERLTKQQNAESQHRSYFSPNMNDSYSNEPSPYGSPYSGSEDTFRPAGATGRIDAASEEELFVTFFNKFHSTLPIVAHTLTPAQAFSVCPLLYHAILLLATLATPNHPLTWTLSQTVNATAPQLALTPPKSVHIVQAFLLLATWPQTHHEGHAIHEKAWLYVSVATHMAQCLGLHRSFLASEYPLNECEVNEDTRQEWVRTWVGCFIVSQFMSTAIGVAPIINEDFTIQNASTLLTRPSSSTYDPSLSILLDKLKEARVGARVSNLLSSCPNSSSGLAEVGDNLAIFRILQGDIQEVEASLLNTDEVRNLSFLWLKIQLYSFALHDGILPEQSRVEFILRGFEASFHFLGMLKDTVEVTPVYMLPVLHQFSAVCAWMFVFKTLYSKYRMYLDVGATENALKDLPKIMTAHSQVHGDFCSESAVMMESLLHKAKSSDSDPFLGVRSRMAASLYYDGVCRFNRLKTHDHESVEKKMAFSSPPQATFCNSLTSSPMLSSDLSTDLSTPPPIKTAEPGFFPEKPIFTEFWTDHESSVESTFIPELPRIEGDWAIDPYLCEGHVGSDISACVAPGMLMVQ